MLCLVSGRLLDNSILCMWDQTTLIDAKEKDLQMARETPCRRDNR